MRGSLIAVDGFTPSHSFTYSTALAFPSSFIDLDDADAVAARVAEQAHRLAALTTVRASLSGLLCAVDLRRRPTHHLGVPTSASIPAGDSHAAPPQADDLVYARISLLRCDAVVIAAHIPSGWSMAVSLH